MLPRCFACVLFLAGVRCLHAQGTSQLDGYVTRVGTPSDFDVNGMRVTCSTPVSVAGTPAAGQPAAPDSPCSLRVYGEHVVVFGKHDRKQHEMHARGVQSVDTFAGKAVSGFAVIDAILPGDMVRADGRAIHVAAPTKLERVEPLAPAAPPQVGEWLAYTGKFAANGVVEASEGELLQPGVGASEHKLLKKSDYDSSSVTEDQRQSGVSKFFKGVDPKQVPAMHDEALQAHLQILGERLIPAVQKQLPPGDPSKLDFHFQLVDVKWSDALTLPNGIILVPAGLARMLNDDELAAVLADNIAAALEKQSYLSLPANHVMTATNLLGVAGSFLIPGLGLATGAGTAVAGHNLQKRELEQSGRTALVLMHDAGFDVQQAPIAWWRLSSSKAEFMRDKVPSRAAYLFEVLATDWAPGSPLSTHPAAASAAP